MPGAVLEPAPQQGLVAREVDEVNIRAPGGENIAVAGFQRRTGEHHIRPLGARGVDRASKIAKPGQAVGIIQRRAGAHLFDIRLWVGIVAVDERRPEGRRQ